MSTTVVLVHGAFVDGSGWRGVYDDLTAGGLDVRVTQHSTKSLADDDAVVRTMLDGVDGPVVLVGHSYGEAVITQAGTHERVAGLVYITAVAPDTGESTQALLSTFPTDGPQPPILPPVNGYLLLDRAAMPMAFAADLPDADAAFMADSQVPCGVEAFSTPITDAAWRARPSWFLHVTDDRMIQPDSQLTMAQRMGATVTDTPGSHAVYVSNPKVVAELIRTAVDAVGASG